MASAALKLLKCLFLAVIIKLKVLKHEAPPEGETLIEVEVGLKIEELERGETHLGEFLFQASAAVSDSSNLILIFPISLYYVKNIDTVI